VSDATSFGAVETAERVGAAALLCPTDTGRSTRVMAAFRPRFPIIAASRYERTIRRTCFMWGVTGLLMPVEDGLARICYGALKVARRAGYVQTDDIVVITAGDPVTSPLTTFSETSTNVTMVAQVF
jgi:pyruvate kinase